MSSFFLVRFLALGSINRVFEPKPPFNVSEQDGRNVVDISFPLALNGSDIFDTIEMMKTYSVAVNFQFLLP